MTPIKEELANLRTLLFATEKASTREAEREACRAYCEACSSADEEVFYTHKQWKVKRMIRQSAKRRGIAV